LFNGDGYFFSDAGKLLGHAVEAGKHGVFAFFKNPSHIGCKDTKVCSKPTISMWRINKPVANSARCSQQVAYA
jgi:hypothetical protein